MSVPAAVAKDGARVYYFEVSAAGADGSGKVMKRVLADGFNHAATHKRASAATDCIFAVDELPKGKVRFAAKAVNCFGRAGAELVSDEMEFARG